MKTLYRATRIYTLSHPAVGEWLLVDGRHVERVGVGDPPLAEREVDLGGTTVVPGFIDTHVHLTGTTLSAIGIPLERARSPQELLGLVAEELTHGPSRILAHGFDETHWDRPDLPALSELDELADIPIILIRADGHIALANSTALDRSGAIEEDGVDRDHDGHPTGVVRKAANRRLQRWFHQDLSDHELRELQLQASALARRGGSPAFTRWRSRPPTDDGRWRSSSSIVITSPSRSWCTSPRRTSRGSWTSAWRR